MKKQIKTDDDNKRDENRILKKWRLWKILHRGEYLRSPLPRLLWMYTDNCYTCKYCKKKYEIPELKIIEYYMCTKGCISDDKRRPGRLFKKNMIDFPGRHVCKMFFPDERIANFNWSDWENNHQLPEDFKE